MAVTEDHTDPAGTISLRRSPIDAPREKPPDELQDCPYCDAGTVLQTDYAMHCDVYSFRQDR